MNSNSESDNVCHNAGSRNIVDARRINKPHTHTHDTGLPTRGGIVYIIILGGRTRADIVTPTLYAYDISVV